MSIVREVLLGDELAKPGCAVAEVEGVEPLLGFALAARDRVERLFHRRGELVVDEVREVALEQLHLRERGPRRHERVALLPHVVALGAIVSMTHAYVDGRPMPRSSSSFTRLASV